MTQATSQNQGRIDAVTALIKEAFPTAADEIVSKLALTNEKMVEAELANDSTLIDQLDLLTAELYDSIGHDLKEADVKTFMRTLFRKIDRVNHPAAYGLAPVTAVDAETKPPVEKAPKVKASGSTHHMPGAFRQ